MAWTQKDEQAYQALLARRSIEVGVLRDCVVRATEQALSHIFAFCDATQDLADVLIENAEQFRKVLEPFDRSAPNNIVTKD